MKNTQELFQHQSIINSTFNIITVLIYTNYKLHSHPQGPVGISTVSHFDQYSTTSCLFWPRTSLLRWAVVNTSFRWLCSKTETLTQHPSSAKCCWALWRHHQPSALHSTAARSTQGPFQPCWPSMEGALGSLVWRQAWLQASGAEAWSRNHAISSQSLSHSLQDLALVALISPFPTYSHTVCT